MRLDQLITDNSGEGGQHDQLQRLVAEGRAKQAEIHLIAPQAREAVLTEIVPQIEDSVTSIEVLDAVVDRMNAEIVEAFKNKNQVYTRLIRYKSIDQSDSQYEKDLIAAMGEWRRSTSDTLAAGDKPGDDVKPQEVTVKVEIDGADKVQTFTDADNLSAKAPDAEDVDVTMEPPFDLGDVRI